MPRRDLIRNVIIVGVLVLALILLRIFVFHPFSINDKMANASVKTGDLVIATRNAQVDRSDLVLYKVGGKEYLGRVIAKENDEVSYVDDVLRRLFWNCQRSAGSNPNGDGLTEATFT